LPGRQDAARAEDAIGVQGIGDAPQRQPFRLESPEAFSDGRKPVHRLGFVLISQDAPIRPNTYPRALAAVMAASVRSEISSEINATFRTSRSSLAMTSVPCARGPQARPHIQVSRQALRRTNRRQSVIEASAGEWSKVEAYEW
jgi:hypothetical protein